MSFDPTHKPRKRDGPVKVDLEKVVQKNKSKFSVPEEQQAVAPAASAKAQKKKESQDDRLRRLAAPKQQKQQNQQPEQQQQQQSTRKASVPSKQKEISKQQTTTKTKSVIVAPTVVSTAASATTSAAPAASPAKNFFANTALDEYGRGAPSERLIFGYSPAVTSEAVAFHSQYPAKEWRTARKENFRTKCLRTPQQLHQEHHRLMQKAGAGSNNAGDEVSMIEDPSLHFESDMSVVQLRLYWQQKAREEQKMMQRQLRGGVASGSGDQTTTGAGPSSSSASAGGNTQFGKLLADMFGDSEFVDNEVEDAGAVSGKRRQRNE